jgi:hypothetical protein
VLYSTPYSELATNFSYASSECGTKQALFASGQIHLDKEKVNSDFVAFVVLTAVVMKSNIIWDITTWMQLKVNQNFRETYRLHLEGQISRAGYRYESRCQGASLANSTLKM